MKKYGALFGLILILAFCSHSIAGIVTKPYTFVNGTVADANQVNSDFDTLYTLVNGNLDSSNLATNSVGTSEIQNDAVNDLKIDWGLGTNQVSAVDVPIADAGTYYPTDNVESALQEISQGTRAASWQILRGATNYLVLQPDTLTGVRTWTFQDATDVVVGRDTLDVLTNKTLTAPTISSPKMQTSIILDQTTADYTLTWDNPAAARAISIPDPLGTDVFVFRDMAQTLDNKKVNFAGASTGTANVQYASSASDWTYTIPDAGAAANFLMTEGAQTIHGVKTFATDIPVFSVAPAFNFAGAPFTVANSTVVTNLNADLLDGHDSSYFVPAGTVGDHHHSATAGDGSNTITLGAGSLTTANTVGLKIIGRDIYENLTNGLGLVRINYYSYNDLNAQPRQFEVYDGEHPSAIISALAGGTTISGIDTGGTIQSTLQTSSTNGILRKSGKSGITGQYRYNFTPDISIAGGSHGSTLLARQFMSNGSNLWMWIDYGLTAGSAHVGTCYVEAVNSAGTITATVTNSPTLPQGLGTIDIFTAIDAGSGILEVYAQNQVSGASYTAVEGVTDITYGIK